MDHTYVSLQALGGVTLGGETVVLVGALRGPGLAGHAQDGYGGRAAVRVSVSNLTV